MRDVLIGIVVFAAAAGSASPAQARIVVGGACRCPAPADVEVELGRLPNRRSLEPRSEETSGQGYRAVLTCPARGTVDVVLRSDSGEPIADRALSSQGSCRARASAVAVIIGAWETDVDPELSPSMTLPVVVLPPPPARSPRKPTVASSGAADARSEDLGPSLSISAALGLVASVAGGQVEPGAMLVGDVLPQGGHLGVAATIAATMSHTSSIGAMSDVVRWSRVTLGVGPDAQLRSGAGRVDLSIQGVAAALSVSGVGLVPSFSDGSAQLGGALSFRGAWALGNSALWAGAQVLVFPGNDRLVIRGVSDEGRLPHVELQLASGVSLGRLP